MVGDKDEGGFVLGTVGNTGKFGDFVRACFKRVGAGVAMEGYEVGFLLGLCISDLLGFPLGLGLLLIAGEFVSFSRITIVGKLVGTDVVFNKRGRLTATLPDGEFVLDTIIAPEMQIRHTLRI